MIARHTLKMTALCPKGGRDHYTVEVQVYRLVEVEKLVEICGIYEGQEIYQEHLAEALAAHIGDCKVKLTGLHGAVHTVTEAETE